MTAMNDETDTTVAKFTQDWGWLLRWISPVSVVAVAFFLGGLWHAFGNMQSDVVALKHDMETVHKLEVSLAKIEGLLQRDPATIHSTQ